MIADAKNSGITAVNITVGAIGNDDALFQDTVAGIAFTDREIESNPGALMKILRFADLQAAKDSGRLGLILGFQDGSMLGTDVDRVEVFYRLGVRIIQPTYNGRNLLGDGCLEPGNAGLSRLRPPGHRAHERTRHPARSESLRPAHDRGRNRGIEGADGDHAFGLPRARRYPSQQARRGAARAGRQGRRHRHLLHALPASRRASPPAPMRSRTSSTR